MAHNAPNRGAAGRRLGMALRNAGRGLLDLFYPPRCAGCGHLGAVLCDACQARIEASPQPACRRCGQPGLGDDLCDTCLVTPSALDGITAAAVFAPPLRAAIHDLKYNNNRSLAEPLGQHMAAAWHMHNLAADRLIPVPLHASRQAERGYNQSTLLARVLADTVGIPLDERTLARQRATQQQVGLGRTERQLNVVGAFTCRGNLSGQRVVLIDDVCTTGATLEACAEALQAAGVASVWAFTLARARWAPGAPPPDAVAPNEFGG